MKVTYYAITRTGTSEEYIGSSINLRGRWKTHRYDLKNKRHHCKALQEAWDLYGPDAFSWSIIETRVCADVNDRAAIELQWIIAKGTYNAMTKYVTTDNLIPMSDQAKALKSAEAHAKIADDPEYANFLQKRGQAIAAYMKSDEGRANMSEHSKRRWQDPEERKRLRAGLDRVQADPEHWKRHGEKIKAAHGTPEMKAMHRENHAKLLEDPGMREKMIQGSKDYWADPANRAKRGEKMRAYHAARRAAKLTD